MLIFESNVLVVSNPTAEMKNWCQKELVIPNPDYAKKSRMGFYTGNTSRTLTFYEVRGDDIVLPYGTKDMIPESIKEQVVWFDNHHSPTPVFFGADIPLYDYQKDALEEMFKAKSGILKSRAGSGKTRIGLALAAKLELKTLWLCHTKDLVKQSRDVMKSFISEDLIGTITEGEVHIGKTITFATVQTMCKLNLADYKNEWDVIICDECHHVSGTPSSVTQYRKVLNSLDARHKYGLSATVHRADGLIKATYSLLGTVKYVVPDEAIADRVMQVGIKPVKTDFELNRDCIDTDGQIVYTKLITALTKDDERNRLIVSSIEIGKPSLILSDRLEHLQLLKDMLPEKERKKAVVITGKTKKLEREKALDEMRKGNKMYLFASYSLAKEGLDVPCLERLYMATPQKDYAVVTQAIGRIARTSEGKENPVCYDFVDDVPMLAKFYLKRRSTYKKNDCYWVEDKND